nr:MAG TPA: hypothetical protein [Caudoviricetes sp.]
MSMFALVVNNGAYKIIFDTSLVSDQKFATISGFPFVRSFTIHGT